MGAIPLHKMTEGEYLLFEEQSEERHEFYEGEVFAMAGGTINHARISGNAFGEIRGKLKGTRCEVFNADLRVQIEGHNLYTYPDLSIVCGDPKYFKGRIDTILNPVVIIEVLSPSTEEYDRGQKFEFYRAVPSLQEYILVSSRRMMAEHYKRMPSGQWLLTVYQNEDDLLQIESAEIAVLLSELYDRVVLLQA